MKKHPNLILVLSYFLLFGINSLVIFLANQYFPQEVVLGTAHISKTWAIIHSMSALALLNTFAIPFLQIYEEKQTRILAPHEWLIFYFVFNSAGLWLISRFANQLGLGLQAWPSITALAASLSFAQGIIMMLLEKVRRKCF